MAMHEQVHAASHWVHLGLRLDPDGIGLARLKQQSRPLLLLRGHACEEQHSAAEAIAFWYGFAWVRVFACR